jgi:hypothetical protein
MKEVRTLSVEEITLEAEDLQMIMTFGVTMSGSYHDLLSLKEYLVNDPRFKVIWKSISPVHLRVVKRDQWDEFQRWRETRRQ